MKLGATLMKSYLQRMSSAGVADKVSLLAHKEFIEFYTKLGFQDEGVSTSELYGGGWVNMVCYFSLFLSYPDPLLISQMLDGFFLGYILFTYYVHIKICARMWFSCGLCFVLTFLNPFNDLYTGIRPLLQPASRSALKPISSHFNP